TALGLDEHPAQLPGWGTLLPATARAMLARYHHGEWRIVLTDPTGRLQHVLLTRHRPRLPDPPPGSPGRSSSRPPGPRRDQHRRRG
ncbi:hypothetical protein, partial [Actinomycetospora sp. NBRC 106375]|uniref:hypothetical protein n=1 Tax=Actinomycetospora sp. NBRC 106375 TaxID=3032207 RepID=UPI0025556002